MRAPATTVTVTPLEPTLRRFAAFEANAISVDVLASTSAMAGPFSATGEMVILSSRSLSTVADSAMKAASARDVRRSAILSSKRLDRVGCARIGAERRASSMANFAIGFARSCSRSPIMATMVGTTTPDSKFADNDASSA